MARKAITKCGQRKRKGGQKKGIDRGREGQRADRRGRGRQEEHRRQTPHEKGHRRERVNGRAKERRKERGREGMYKRRDE